MDYARFLRQGEPAWEETARLLGRARAEGLERLDLSELEALAAGHRRVVGDFATARSHFPGTAAETRLRGLAFAGHRVLVSPRPALGPRLWRFLRHGYPAIFRQHLDAVGASLAIFLLATVAGFVIAAINVEFAQLWLGAGAVDGLRRGEIWTDELGQVVPPALLSAKIFTNNISVALIAWLLGAVLGLGSLYVLGMNGMMFGSVLALTWRYEMMDRLFAFISAHGPLELFLIVVSGGAGLLLAEGQLRWRNRPRAETFPEAGQRSLLLMAGTVPWFVLLGVVEGFLSPVMSMPTAAKGLVGVLLLATFLGYVLLSAPDPAPAETA